MNPVVSLASWLQQPKQTTAGNYFSYTLHPRFPLPSASFPVQAIFSHPRRVMVSYELREWGKDGGDASEEFYQ